MNSNVWNNRTALVAIMAAFLAGLIIALSVRNTEPADQSRGEVTEQNQKNIHWRVPIAFGSNLPALGDNIVRVAGELNSATNSRIFFETFEPGMLVPAFSITEGVKDAKIEAGYTWLGYDQGRIPATPLLAAVPFGMEPWEYAAWYYEDEGKQLAEALYAAHNIHPVFCGIVGPETAGWFRQPITSLDDFKGLKIRFAGLGGKVLQRLGASVTMIPGGEIFQALEKGAIDATEYSMPAVDEMLGFDRVATYNYFPGWHQTFTAAHLVVNLDLWRSLSMADQTLIDMACTAGVIRNLSRGEAIQGDVLIGFPDKGVTPVKFDEAILHRLYQITQEVLEEEALADEDFARIWTSQKKFLASYRHWKDKAYLPRDFNAD